LKIAASTGNVLGKITLRECLQQLCLTLLCHHKNGLVVIWTGYNSATLHLSCVPLNLLVVDGANRLAESDLIFALKIQHDSLVQIGNQTGAQPPTEPQGNNDMYEKYWITNFRRMLQHVHHERIELPEVG